ncbi:hypothetical protein BRC81_03980 [Halobacteriales archaeon QS_1_68_20]|nr:MAG: hypothetical protein BRC81_03980 [Halobacteriales archaeon QS_1_68_20]
MSAGADFETSKDETVRFVADVDPDDADVEIVSYEWRRAGNNGNGKGKGNDGGGEVLSIEPTFETELKVGKHVITLTVETADGRTLTDDVTVLVRGKGGDGETDSPPVADADDCRMVIADEDAELNGSESDDRDGIIEGYEWT